MNEILYNIYDEEAIVEENGKVKFEDGTEKQFGDMEAAIKYLYKLEFRF